METNSCFVIHARFMVEFTRPLSPLECLSNRESRFDVILSVSEELAFLPATKPRSFGYCLRMTLEHSLVVEDKGRAVPSCSPR